MSEPDVPVLARFSLAGKVAPVAGASPASSYIAGVTLAVDGGMSGH